MANKPTKPIRLAPQTKEEQEMQVARFFANKREQFAINILANLLRNEKVTHETMISVSGKDGREHTNVNILDIVDHAIEGADRLLEKLYPVKLEDKK